MPQLKRLLRADEPNDAVEKVTAEQLLSSSIYSQEMRMERKRVAALCSASFVTMSMLTIQQNVTSEVLDCLSDTANTHTIDKCIDATLQVTSREKHVLFLVRDPKLVTKRLAVAVMSADAAMTPEFAAECLHRVHFRNCRSIYDLQCELDRIEKDWKDMQEKLGIQFVAIGPLCDLLSDFQTASGNGSPSIEMVSGAGIKRMVELAIKRLRGTTNIHVSVIKTRSTWS